LSGYAYADNNPVTHSDPTGLKVANCTPGADCGPINGGTSSGTVRPDWRPPGQGTGRDYTTWHNKVVKDAIATIRGQATALGWNIDNIRSEVQVPGGSKKTPCRDLNPEGCVSGRADIVLTVVAPDGSQLRFVWEVKSVTYGTDAARREALQYVSWMNQDAIVKYQAPNASVGWDILGPYDGVASTPQTKYWGGNSGAVVYGNKDQDKVKTETGALINNGTIGWKFDPSQYKDYQPRSVGVPNQPTPAPGPPQNACPICVPLPPIIVEVPVGVP